MAVREAEPTAGQASLPVTEAHRLTRTGHQTAVVCTARRLNSPVLAGQMFARWCPQDFFAYMMQHYDIDGLVQYGAEPLPGTLEVIHPDWRSLDKAVKATHRNLRHLQAKLGSLTRADDVAGIQKKAEYVQDIQANQAELQRLRAERKKMTRKVPLSSLPQEQRPTQLLP